MDKFDLFVIPFTLGFVFIVVWLIVTVIKLFVNLPFSDKKLFARNLLTYHTVVAIFEILSEVLVHRRIWKEKPILGYMHMSFALGWFGLIVFGWIETALTSDEFLPLWCHIFYRFFYHGEHQFVTAEVMANIMDFWLLFILSGQLIAVFKRFFTKRVGLKIRPRHNRRNRNAMTALWFIFPLRLLSESTTAALYGGGGFLTGGFGSLLSGVPFIEYLEMPFWWGYSIALCAFFFLIPSTRYLHIAIEGFLILFRNWKFTDLQTLNRIETMACSACGMCLSDCPLARTNVAGIQPVYFIERLRDRKQTDDDVWKCLACGRCEEICPVRVQSINLRNALKGSHTAITNGKDKEKKDVSLDNVVIFGGCMGKMTPRTRIAMEKILGKAGITYTFVDEDQNLCCGRPLLMNGKTGEAKLKFSELMSAINALSPKVIVTTCPICYNMMKNQFSGVPVMHHTEYVKLLINSGLIKTKKLDDKITYHDPCELARKGRIVNEPVEVLKHVANLQLPKEHGRNTRCCGGALAGIGLNNNERKILSEEMADYLEQTKAEKIVTACPLCKKNIAQKTQLQVLDFAEMVAQAIE